MFAITDGQTSATALLRPESYGETGAEAIYTVEGTYSFARGGEPTYARLYFSNGSLRHAYGFTGQGETDAPREIVPEPGDKFTILERWLDAGKAGQPAASAAQPGKTLTFSRQTLTWKELDAAAGDYVIGFIAQDLDGNSYQSYAKVTVK
jgi:hypothetical protein